MIESRHLPRFTQRILFFAYPWAIQSFSTLPSSRMRSGRSLFATETSPQDFSTEYHAPVMWKECIDALLSCERQSNRIFVDGTLGGGGHSEALLRQLSADDVLYGCDVDPEAIATAEERLTEYILTDKNKPTFISVNSNFANLVENLPVSQVDGILLDLGVSSHQINEAERGFAFGQDGPLDMRMCQTEGSSFTAANLVNTLDEQALSILLKKDGQEPRCRKIAASIVQHRPLSTTAELVEAVAAVVPQFHRQKRLGRTATLARVFQAVRRAVNREDKVLEQALLEMAPTLLRPGGCLVVLSYHSLEDVAVKRCLRDGRLDGKRVVEKDLYGNELHPKPFKSMSKPTKPTEEEVRVNSRARSATLRIGRRQDTSV